jgi:hypothetical protein
MVDNSLSIRKNSGCEKALLECQRLNDEDEGNRIVVKRITQRINPRYDIAQYRLDQTTTTVPRVENMAAVTDKPDSFIAEPFQTEREAGEEAGLVEELVREFEATKLKKSPIKPTDDANQVNDRVMSVMNKPSDEEEWKKREKIAEDKKMDQLFAKVRRELDSIRDKTKLVTDIETRIIDNNQPLSVEYYLNDLHSVVQREPNTAPHQAKPSDTNKDQKESKIDMIKFMALFGSKKSKLQGELSEALKKTEVVAKTLGSAED